MTVLWGVFAFHSSVCSISSHAWSTSSHTFTFQLKASRGQACKKVFQGVAAEAKQQLSKRLESMIKTSSLVIRQRRPGDRTPQGGCSPQEQLP